MNCESLGLRKCRGCIFHEKHPINKRCCWIEIFAKRILIHSDEQIKETYIKYRKANDYGYFDPDWIYYYVNALIKLFPQRAHIIEKLLILS